MINEIMYHPPGGSNALQFIELFNRSDSAVELSNWAFTKGIKFTFPAGSRIEPKGFLVLCRDRNAFLSHYGQVGPLLGPFTGRFSHKRERVELTDARGEVIDSIQYSDSDGWPKGADGYSSSLERICPFASGERPDNWAASNWPQTKGAAGSPGRRNDCFSAGLPPSISQVEFAPKCPKPQQKVKVTATVSDPGALKSVSVLFRVASPGKETEEQAVPMTRTGGDEKAAQFEAWLEPQAQGHLVRFRVQAVGADGAQRFQPSENEPRPTYSYYCLDDAKRAGIPIGEVLNVGRMARGPGHYQRGPARKPAALTSLRGNAAFVYLPSDSGELEVFDYVKAVTRSGGYKVHFQKDHSLKGMTGINLISEGPLRWILSEPLSYVLYRMAGVPAELTEHVRLSIDGRRLGFFLLVEQPNKSFLARNGRDDSGNLYKLIWYEQGIVRQHEKKTNKSSGHEDIIQLLEGLRRTSGAAQWKLIEQNLNVEEFINYYAVNMCIQNWDGFFNNYFLYHDTGKTGKWEIYPWDEDKTWGDYDGASPQFDWYEMPLTFGMNGDRSPGFAFRFGGGPFGGASWWRPPGYMSGPLLANPEFRARFLARLEEICQTVFTEQNFIPIIDAMEKRLQPEVRARAEAMNQNVSRAEREFASDMQSFRNQVQNRRKFILSQLRRSR